MPFSSLPLATTGPEYPTSPGSSAPAATGALGLTRKRAIGNASAQIDPTKVCTLYNIAPGAQSAIIVVEAANNTIPPGTVLMRIWMDGEWPTTISGLPLYDGQPYEIIGADDLKNARIISQDGNQHVMQIQYFSYL